VDIDHLVAYIRQIKSKAEMHDVDAQKEEVEAERMKDEAKKSGADTQRREAKALAWETETQRGTKAAGKMFDYGEAKSICKAVRYDGQEVSVCTTDNELA
jgi:hypothetical protein